MAAIGELAREWLAVDAARVTAPSAALAAWIEGLRARPALRGELRLIETAALPPELRLELDACAALHPVLQQAGAHLVVLPEVRVELRDAAAEAVLRAEIECGSLDASIEALADAVVPTLVLRPRSGRGADALRLADALRDRPGVRALAPRLLRIVPRTG